MLSKKIIFVTSTRADFGKLKSLIKITKKNSFEVFIFATGMHMLKQFGMTYKEVVKNFNCLIFCSKLLNNFEFKRFSNFK